MSHSDIDSGSSDSQYQIQQQNQEQNDFIVSILRHLPEARKIMQGHNYQHQATKCLYQQPLSNNPTFIVPKANNTQTAHLSNNRLVKLEDVLFQHENMKEKIKNMLQKDGKKNGQKLSTLWVQYSSMTPSYARFGNCARKNNFANVLMPINGVNVVLGSKFADKIVDSQKKFFPTTPDSVRFDSHFQSGNLLYAYRKQNLQMQTYDLILQNDINTKGHNQWFYFKVYNTKQHNKIRFNIINFIKDESMFSYGIKPLVFSERDYSRHRIGWVREGEKVCYYENNMRRQCNGNSYYTLSFQYYFREIDTVYFAPIHPYTYTQLTEYFDNLMAEHSLANFISIKTVAQTVGRNSITVVTIGSGKKQIKDCSVVWVLGRQHPGETTSSYMVEGIINYLVSLYSGKGNKSELLDNFIFKIVPMLNVDGVIHGNTRAELTGVDPNRMWKKTLKRLSPGVSVMKKLIAENKQNVKLVLDLHSHSKKLGCFFYGNFLIHDPKKTKIYPSLVCESDERFELKNCRFRGGYQTTARSVLFSQLGIKQVYTVQCSLLGYLKKNRITEYKISDYHDMGKKLIECFIDLQKEKIVKAENQIIEQMGGFMIDRQDAQSARSQSSLSDEEYEEIKHKVKKVKKKKVKKCQEENVPLTTENNNQEYKYYFKNNPKPFTKIDLSLNEKKRRCFKKETLIDELKLKNQNIPALKNIQTQPIILKKVGTLNIHEGLTKIDINMKTNKQNESQFRKSQNNSILAKGRIDTLSNIGHKQLYGNVEKRQVELQVNINIQKDENKRYGSKRKSQKSLCVFGSSLEDDLVYAYKNEVGIQAYQQIVEQTLTTIGDGTKKSLKIKKIPKFLNYLCSNLIGVSQQNSVLPQDRRLAPLVTKKYAGNVKN